MVCPLLLWPAPLIPVNKPLVIEDFISEGLIGGVLHLNAEPLEADNIGFVKVVLEVLEEGGGG